MPNLAWKLPQPSQKKPPEEDRVDTKSNPKQTWPCTDLEDSLYQQIMMRTDLDVENDW